MPSYRLSLIAQEDIVQILAHTEQQFGDMARRRYELLLVTCLRDLASDPERIGSTARPEFGLAVSSYHLRHSRNRARAQDSLVRRPRHLLLYRAMRGDMIGIGRVLHDSMEIELHLPSQYGDE